MNNGYLVPANAKKSKLIWGMFELYPDLIVLIISLAITGALLFAFSQSENIYILLSCLPGIIGILLVMPVPNYHNTMCVIQSVMDFYFNDRRKFIWRGWCVLREQNKK